MRNPSAKENYIEKTFGLDDPDLRRVREELVRRDVAFMSISGAEARILQFLIRGFGVRTIVEVGTLFGYSALCMAKALPADGRLFTAEKNPENFVIAEEFFKSTAGGEKITAVLGDARETLSGFSAHGPFDMVFIDADKPGYLDYLNWAEANVRPGGLIVGDNTFLFDSLWGESRDPKVKPAVVEQMMAFNSRLADRSRYNSVIIPTVEGMTVAQKV